MKRFAIGLTCIVAATGYVVGCGSTSGTVNRGNQGGSAGNGVGASGGTTGSGGSGASSSGGSGASSSGGSGASSSGGSGASGSGGSGASGSQDSGIPDVVFNYDGPADDGGFNTDASCAEVTAKAEPLPLDLYVVLDRSGSMVLSSPQRWPPVKSALTQFFESPTAAGIGAALTLFAHPTKNECSSTSYATPLVAMAPLPGSATGQALSLVNMMNAHTPVSGVGTPTVEAMQGASTYAKSYKNSHPTHTVAIVLATDGIPGDPGCTESAAAVKSVVSSTYTGTPSIKTYVIGIDPDTTMKANLNSWAAASGTTAFDVATSGGSSQFLQAMKNIQSSALGCKYNMPTTDAGIIDPNKVNVEYTPGGTKTAQSLPKVSGAGACGNSAGWYYDNNQTPTTITLCKASCDTVQADSGAKVAVNLGCLGS